MAQRVIQETAERLKAVFQADRQRIGRDPAYAYRLADDILIPHVDMQRMSSLVLGRYWRQALAVQRQAFEREFRRLLVRTYATALYETGDWGINKFKFDLPAEILRQSAGDYWVGLPLSLLFSSLLFSSLFLDRLCVGYLSGFRGLALT